MTELEKVELTPGQIAKGGGARWTVLGLCHPREGGGHRGVALFVAVGGEERELEVEVGETFPVGAQVWRLDSIRDEDDYGATISRVS